MDSGEQMHSIMPRAYHIGDFYFFNTKVYCNYGIIPWICGISKLYPFRQTKSKFRLLRRRKYSIFVLSSDEIKFRRTSRRRYMKKTIFVGPSNFHLPVGQNL